MTGMLRGREKSLVPDAIVPAAEMVLGEELAGRAEAANLFHGCGRGTPACAEEFGGLEFFKGMALVVLAVRAVFPADLPVLFGILYDGFVGTEHGKKGVRLWIIDFLFCFAAEN